VRARFGAGGSVLTGRLGAGPSDHLPDRFGQVRAGFGAGGSILTGRLGSGAVLTRGASEAGVATAQGHVEEPGTSGAEDATPTSEEHVPAQTREQKQDPMGRGMALNSERKSKSDDGRGSNFSAKGKEDSSNMT
jgi:hypothetical protein